MSKEVENVLTNGLHAGYAGGKPENVTRGTVDGKVSHIKQVGRDKESGDRHQDQSAGGPFHVRLIQQVAQARSHLHFEQEAIQKGDCAEQLFLADIDDRIGRFLGVGAQSRIKHGEGPLRLLGSTGAGCDQQQRDHGEYA